jgi:hypothetical protein
VASISLISTLKGWLVSPQLLCSSELVLRLSVSIALFGAMTESDISFYSTTQQTWMTSASVMDTEQDASIQTTAISMPSTAVRTEPTTAAVNGTSTDRFRELPCQWAGCNKTVFAAEALYVSFSTDQWPPKFLTVIIIQCVAIEKQPPRYRKPRLKTFSVILGARTEQSPYFREVATMAYVLNTLRGLKDFRITLTTSNKAAALTLKSPR